MAQTKTIKYLKDKSYYENLYDRHTVDFCRRLESRYNESIKDRVGKKMTEKDRANLAAHELVMYFEAGERYLQKEDTIKKWIDRDKAKDELLKNAVSPDNIYCNDCGEIMYVENKTLYSIGTEEERVLFLFRCSIKCKKGRGIFNDGEEWIIKPELCDKCGLELNKKDERKDKKILTHYDCPECDFKKTEELDLSVKEEKEKIDKFFNRDRSRFCLNEKKGQEYYSQKMNIEKLKKIVKDVEERDKNKEVYEKVSKLKKLTIDELEKILIPALKKEGYIKFELGKPEMGKDVFIEFSARDEKSGREEYDSKKNLKKIISKTLEVTNWRLMSERISYRLGFLSGRLRGYEREEDLIKLISK